MTNKIISDRLKKARLEKNLTQKELADNLDVALSVIAGAETKRGISKTLAIKLAKFFKTDEGYWLNPNAEKEFIKNSKGLETLEEVFIRLIKEDLIQKADDINKKEIRELVNQAERLELEILLRKEKGTN